MVASTGAQSPHLHTYGESNDGSKLESAMVDRQTHVQTYVRSASGPSGLWFSMSRRQFAMGTVSGQSGPQTEGEPATAAQARDLEEKHRLLPSLCLVQKMLALPGPLPPACSGSFRNSGHLGLGDGG